MQEVLGPSENMRVEETGVAASEGGHGADNERRFELAQGKGDGVTGAAGALSMSDLKPAAAPPAQLIVTHHHHHHTTPSAVHAHAPAEVVAAMAPGSHSLPPGLAGSLSSSNRRALPDHCTCTLHVQPQEGVEGEPVVKVTHSPFVIGRGRGSDWFIPGENFTWRRVE